MMGTKYFMKFGTIKGNSADAKFNNQVELTSLNFSIERHVSQETGSIRRSISYPDITYLRITKLMDSSSIGIMDAALTGTGVDCVISLVGSESLVFQQYTLKNAVIAYYEVKGASHDDVPIETFRIYFTDIKSTYNTINALGKIGDSASVAYSLPLAKKM